MSYGLPPNAEQATLRYFHLRKANAHHHPPEVFLTEASIPRAGRVNDVVGRSLGGCNHQDEKPTGHPGLRPWGSGPGLCGFTGGPVITGAGLDPSCAPAGIPSSSSDGEGCWGRGTARTQTVVGVVVVRVVAVPVGRAAVMRVVEPGTAAQQLGDPPSSSV
jgi:hypothetical protein